LKLTADRHEALHSLSVIAEYVVCVVGTQIRVTDAVVCLVNAIENSSVTVGYSAWT